MANLSIVTCDIPIFGSILSNKTTKRMDLRKDFPDKQIDKFHKKHVTGEGSGIALRNNEIKDIMKVIQPSENRVVLLKITTKNVASQGGGFLNFIRPLMAASLPLIKNVLTLLAKIVLVPLGLTAPVSAADVAIQKKPFRSGTIALINSNEEMEDIMKTVKSFEESVLFKKDISETIKNEAKEQKEDFSECY